MFARAPIAALVVTFCCASALAGGRTLPIPRAAPPERAATGGTLEWEVPEGWTVERPSNSMRRAQYRIDGADGPAELVVFYFGPGQGGDPTSNAVRWAGQLTQPDGTPSAERMQIARLEGTAVPVQLVEVSGDYGGGMSGAAIPGATLLAGIAEGPDAPWFFKMVGPAATVRAHREAFVAMMRSLRAAD